MPNDVKLIGVKVPNELHEKIKDYTETNDISMSDFIRDAIKRRLNGKEQSLNEPLNDVEQRFNEQLKEENERLHQRLEQAMETIQQMQSDFESSKQRSDTIILQFTRQFEEQTKLLEDMRQQQESKNIGFFQKLFQRRLYSRV
jgi:Arc/MetJ-type ribon-helix-helix transcriptional regulator